MLKKTKFASFSGTWQEILGDLQQEPMVKPYLVALLTELQALLGKYTTVGRRRLEFGHPELSGTIYADRVDLQWQWRNAIRGSLS